MLIKVKNKYAIERFNKINLTLRFDSLSSTFAFSLYFDSQNTKHKYLFKPLSYNKITIENDNEILLTGTILNQTFSSTIKKKLSTISGYSLPGILENSNIPLENYPLQHNNKTFKEIVEHLLIPFNISYVIDSNVQSKMNEVIEKVVANPTDSIKSFISSIANQKNIILTHTPVGELYFTSVKTNLKPLFHFTDRTINTSISLKIQGQRIHSTITAQKQQSIDSGNAGESTINNPFCDIIKPYVTVQNEGNDIDTDLFARNRLNNELRGIQLQIQLNTWRLNNKLIKPNNTILVTSPENYIYKKTKWFIESVNFLGTENEQTCVINCVLPFVYDGSKVFNIFD